MTDADQTETTDPGNTTVSPIRRFGAVVFVDFAGVSIVVFALLMLLPVGASIMGTGVLAILTVALVRIITETLQGASPGKRLANLRVEYRDSAGAVLTGRHRLLPAVIRNCWLWIPVLLALIAPENIVSGLAVTALLSILFRKQGRLLPDRLAGTTVRNAVAPEKGAR